MMDRERPTIPQGKAAGCLLRSTKLGEVCPLLAEHVPLIPRSDWPKYGTDLRPFVRTVLDQDGVGSCAAESTTQAIMVGRTFAGLEHVPLNPWSLYHVTSHGRDGGSSIDENLAVARDRGICPESVWPRSKGWRAAPSPEALEAAKAFRIVEFYDIANVDEFASALLLGFPVVWGASGHAICAVQHTPNYPLIVNSWATSWGDGGFGKWVNYSGVNFAYGAFAVRTVASIG